LPNRKNLVLTRDKGFQAEGIQICHNWESAIKSSDGTPFVIGGAEIFKQALPRLRRLYLTLIFENIPGDAFFPELDLKTDFVLEEESDCFSEPMRFQFQNWRHSSA
jgi:dihydrofolate reductase